MPHDEAKADQLASRISLGLTIAQLSARLRCAECGGQLHSVKPWRVEDVLGKPFGRGNNVNGKCPAVPNAAGRFPSVPWMLRAR